jgi:hypothetical protein
LISSRREDSICCFRCSAPGARSPRRSHRSEGGPEIPPQCFRSCT